MDKLKILVAGVGGVGGLIAAQLIKCYGDSVTLLARGVKRKNYLENGLTLKSDLYGEYTVHPAAVVEDANGLEAQDLILVSVKNGSLESVAQQFRGCAGPDTVIMPVMNGVSAADKLHSAFPDSHVINSVIYTVSSVQEDMSIRQLGKFTKIFAGPVVDNDEERRACRFCTDTLSQAGISIKGSEDVRAACWSKYVLNCAYNVVTARWGITIGDIKHDDKLLNDYRYLMEEAWKVGRALGVDLPDDLLDKHMVTLERTTDDSTSSLSRDFDIHIKGEADLFSKDVIDMGRSAGIETPYLEEYYSGLMDRVASWDEQA